MEIRVFSVIIGIMLNISASAQFFYNPYQQQQANQRAYNTGRAMMMVQQGYTLIYNGDYEDAIEVFKEAIDLNYAPAYECLGICYELGIGCDRDTDWADVIYEEGAEANSIGCKNQIRRINRQGHQPASFRETYLQNFRANYQAMYGGGNASGGYAPSYGGGNVEADVDHSCRACNNTGVCNGCGGDGISYGTTRCNMCHGTGKCMICGGKGWH